MNFFSGAVHQNISCLISALNRLACDVFTVFLSRTVIIFYILGGF